MEAVIIRPTRVRGSIRPPASKSYGHRLLITSALADSPVDIYGLCKCDDVKVTIDCLRNLGSDIKKIDDYFHVKPIKRIDEEQICLNFGQSGSSARFLLPIVAALGIPAKMIGEGRLPERPIGQLTSLLRRHGVNVSSDRLPIEISGTLRGEEFEIDGSVSSQFVSGMLFALSATGRKSKLTLVGDIQSANYIEMTLEVLKEFGIVPTREGRSFLFDGKTPCAAKNALVVEGDWSAAAFWLTAGAIGAGDIVLRGLSHTSLQGDRAIVDALSRFGAKIKIEDNGDITASGGSGLRAAVIDCKNIPDLVPILSVAAAYAEGESRFDSIARLRVKESDRVAAIISMLGSFGIAAHADDDHLYVTGGRPVGGKIDSFKDHRIAMAAAICALSAEGESTVLNHKCTSKSYPSFWDDLMTVTYTYTNDQ